MIVDSFFLSYNDETKYVKEIVLMANCFFIDFENVHNAGLSNLKGLTKDDLLSKLRLSSVILSAFTV